jgi:hypothetical protein
VITRAARFTFKLLRVAVIALLLRWSRSRAITAKFKTEPPVVGVHEPVPALAVKPVSTPPQVTLPLIRTRPTAILAVFGVVVTGLALISWGIGNRGKRSTENHEGNGKAASARALKLERLTATGQSQHVAISHDGKYVAYTRGSETRLVSGCGNWPPTQTSRSSTQTESPD